MKPLPSRINWYLPLRFLVLSCRQSGLLFSSELILFFFFCFLGLHLQHVEVPRLGFKLELQLPATATVTATQDPSHICNLHHSSRQGRTLNPLSGARDGTRNLMVPSRIRFHCARMGTLNISTLDVRVHSSGM